MGRWVDFVKLAAGLAAEPFFVSGLFGFGGAALLHGRAQSGVNDKNSVDRGLKPFT